MATIQVLETSVILNSLPEDYSSHLEGHNNKIMST